MHVPVGVDDEAVAAERVADGAGCQQAQVDAPRGELLEKLEQCTGVVLGQLDDERGLVGARRRSRGDGAADEHEARHRVGVVADVLGEHLDLVMRDDSGRRDRGICGTRLVEHTQRAGDVALRRQVRVGGQVLAEPAEALPVGDGVRGDQRDVVETGARPADEHEVHRHQVLADDAQPRHGGQGVLRGGDAAVDRVLDRDHRGIRPPLDNVGQRFADVAHGPPDLIASLGHLRERRLGERSGRPQVAVGTAGGRGVGVGQHGVQPRPRGCGRPPECGGDDRSPTNPQ